MIRKATYEDIPQMSGLIADFLQEMPYNFPLLAPEVTARVLEYCVASDDVYITVIDHQGLLVGMVLAERTPDMWTDATRICEHIMYVRPGYRKTSAVGKLLLDFKAWTEEVPSIVRVEASSGIDDDHAAKVFAKLGWKPRGQLFGSEG